MGTSSAASCPGARQPQQQPQQLLAAESWVLDFCQNHAQKHQQQQPLQQHQPLPQQQLLHAEDYWVSVFLTNHALRPHQQLQQLQQPQQQLLQQRVEDSLEAASCAKFVLSIVKIIFSCFR